MPYTHQEHMLMHMTSCQLLYHTLPWSYTNQKHIPIHMTPFQLTYFMSLILVRNILYHRRIFFSEALMQISWILKHLRARKYHTCLIRFASLHISWITYRSETDFSKLGSSRTTRLHISSLFY